MEGLLFLAVGILLYLVADRILQAIERRRGARFEQRTVIFFFLLLGLALAIFPFIRMLLST